NSLLQFRVLLSHNLFEPHRSHSSFLKLRERTARFDRFMLPRVAYQQNPISRMKPFDELVHLARRGKRRLVEYIERFLTCVRLLSPRKMALQRRGLDAGLGQLLRRARRGSETFDLVAFGLHSFPDHRQGRCLARTSESIQTD